MSLEFLEGGDHHNAAPYYNTKWNGTSSAFAYGAGRFGGGAYYGVVFQLTGAQLSSVATRVVGWAYYLDAAQTRTFFLLTILGPLK